MRWSALRLRGQTGEGSSTKFDWCSDWWVELPCEESRSWFGEAFHRRRQKGKDRSISRCKAGKRSKCEFSVAFIPRTRFGSSQCGNPSTQILISLLSFSSFFNSSSSTHSPESILSLPSLLIHHLLFHFQSLSRPSRRSVRILPDPVEFRTLELERTPESDHTFFHTPTSSIIMRATFALRDAARTPLIRFLGKRTVPRM